MNSIDNVKPYFGNIQTPRIQNAQQNAPQTQDASGAGMPVQSSNNIQGIYNSVKPNIPVGYTKIGIQKTPYGDDIHHFKLANGQNVAIMKKEGTTIVNTFVKTGSMNEQDRQRGISHFIEHNLFNGSENYAPGDVFKITNEMGAYTNAATSFAQTNYYISSASMDEDELKKVISLQADMLQRPTFPIDMIEKEKGPVTSEISMATDDSGANISQTVLKNLFNINSTSTHLIAGNIENINNLTRDDVVDYWQKYYTPDNMTTVVVGDVDVDKTIELIAQNFNAKPANNQNKTFTTLNPIQSPKRVDEVSQVNNTGNVVAAFAAPAALNTKEGIVMSALSYLLTGYPEARLTKNLEQINSYCDFEVEQISSDSTQPQASMFYVTAPKEQTQASIDILYGTLEQFKQYPPTQDEMTIVKQYLNKLIAKLYESSDDICSTIGRSILNGYFGDISEYKNIVDSLTPADLVNAAAKYFDLNKVSLGVCHAKGTTADEIQNAYLRSSYANNSKNISFSGNKNLTTDDVQEYMLPDNSRIILNNTNSDLSYINWRLTSYQSVPQNKAAYYVLSELLNNGSMFKDKTQYKKESYLNGISYNIDANGFSITMDANCMKENLPTTIDMLKESLLNPRFTQEEFDKAKQKIASYFSTSTKEAETILISQLYPQFFASEEEILEGLKSLTLEDVKAHYQDIMNNASSNIVISAPFKNNQGLEQQAIAKSTIDGMRFKDQQVALSQIYSPIPNTKIYAQAQERNQAQILKTYSFKMNGNIEDEVKFELLNTILGGTSSSRLFNDLREKQKLAYSVSSQIQSFGDTGLITCQILTTTDDKAQGDIKYDNMQKSLEGFEANTQLLQNELVTDEELENAKKVLKQNVISECELPSSETELLAVNATLPYGIKRIDEYFKTIDKITKEDIQIAARHAFSNNATISILASEDTLKNQKSYLQTQGELYM